MHVDLSSNTVDLFSLVAVFLPHVQCHTRRLSTRIPDQSDLDIRSPPPYAYVAQSAQSGQAGLHSDSHKEGEDVP